MILIKSDARRIPLRDETVQCCVTSPPYYRLRDYGVAGQIGLEQTPDEYIAELVLVFREVWRVLRRDGTLWINIGDSYAGSGGPGNQHMYHKKEGFNYYSNPNKKTFGMKPKDLIGIPWMLAFALRDIGWYLRQDIIWHKPNPMPESVKDRCTKAHEYLFMFSKSKQYYFDPISVSEPAIQPGNWKTPDGWDTSAGNGGHGSFHRKGREKGHYNYDKPCNTKNLRSVWTIATKPYPGAHFAVFPPKLIEPCIKAGSRPGDYVLDPFGGSGTTVCVATELQRIGIHCDLTYHDLAKKTRCRNIQVRMDL